MVSLNKTSNTFILQQVQTQQNVSGLKLCSPSDGQGYNFVGSVDYFGSEYDYNIQQQHLVSASDAQDTEEQDTQTIQQEYQQVDTPEEPQQESSEPKVQNEGDLVVYNEIMPQKIVELKNDGKYEVELIAGEHKGKRVEDVDVNNVKSVYGPSETCVICLDQDCDTIFLDCGHYCCCNKCATNLKLEDKCPVCRKEIEIYPVKIQPCGNKKVSSKQETDTEHQETDTMTIDQQDTEHCDQQAYWVTDTEH